MSNEWWVFVVTAPLPPPGPLPPLSLPALPALEVHGVGEADDSSALTFAITAKASAT